MPGQQPGKMTWDGEAHTQLLLSILAAHEISVDFKAVADLLGPQCTPRAVQEQLKKLKKKALEQAGGDSNPASKAKAAITPKKGKKANPTSEAATPGGEAKSAAPAKKRGRKAEADATPTAKKQKVNAPMKGKKKGMDHGASSPAPANGARSPSHHDSEATTVKLEPANNDDDASAHHYTTVDGSGIPDEELEHSGGEDSFDDVEIDEPMEV
ncbi:MAG: hypothetical protein LQ338_006241 [Usnochroma carphineum]|nr:MAG: hypothetical protein LQ338_006241 [Usnochroma carphineum]